MWRRRRNNNNNSNSGAGEDGDKAASSSSSVWGTSSISGPVKVKRSSVQRKSASAKAQGTTSEEPISAYGAPKPLNFTKNAVAGYGKKAVASSQAVVDEVQQQATRIPTKKMPAKPKSKKKTTRLEAAGLDVKAIPPTVSKAHDASMRQVRKTNLGELRPTVTREPLALPSWQEQLHRRGLAGVREENAAAAFEAALQNGDAQEWGRAKLMLVGQGRAGKTSTVRSLLGLPFENTDSTVGVDLKMTKSVDWQERDIGESDFEQQTYRAAVARLRNGANVPSYAVEAAELANQRRVENEKRRVAAGLPQPSDGEKRASLAQRISRRLSGMTSGSAAAIPAAAIPAASEASDSEDGNSDEDEQPSDLDADSVARASRGARRSLPGSERAGSPDPPVERKIKPLVEHDDVAKRFDVNLIVKALAPSEDHGNIGPEGDINFSIWDYGGQEVFYTLHHVFLSRFGVYVVCFDMSEALRDSAEVVRYLRFWLNSISLHAPDAPFLLVGTFMDKVSKREEHQRIDHILREELKIARYSALIPNDADPKGPIGFFPINNRVGGGENIKLLRTAIEDSVRSAEYVKQKVSLRWMKVLDDLLEREESHVPLAEVKELSAGYGIAGEEAEQMLNYFDELGVLIHLTATSELRQYVVTKPQWLLDQLSLVISDAEVDGHARSAYDADLRRSQLNVDYDRLRQEGIASLDLLHFLWKDQPVEYLLSLMRSMMLLSDWNFGYGEEAVGQHFLVPSLCPRGSIEDELSGPTCYLDFSAFFLPIGVFQRLIALVADHSSLFEDSGEPVLRQDSALLSFGFTDFRLDVLEREEKIRITISEEAEDVARTIKTLVSMFRKLKDDVMGKRLVWKLTLAAKGNPRSCVQYETALKAVEAKRTKVRGENRAIIKTSDLTAFFAAAEQLQGSLVDDTVPTPKAVGAHVVQRPLGKFGYHVFLSHKQSTAGDAVAALGRNLTARGLRCWFDQNERKLNKEAMAQGIKNSAVYLLFLSKEVFDSTYVKFELSMALELSKPIILLHESDPQRKYAYCDFSEYMTKCPPVAKTLFEDVESLPFRRRFYESEAMLAELDTRIMAAIQGTRPPLRPKITYQSSRMLLQG